MKRLTSILGAALLSAGTSLLPIAGHVPFSMAHAQTQTYVATVLPIASTPLNAKVFSALKDGMPEVSFHAAGSTLANPEPFLKALKNTQIPSSGSSTLTVGSTSIPIDDARAIAKSQFVLAPAWSFGNVQFTGPHEDAEGNWSIYAESPLTLTLNQFSTRGSNAESLGNIKDTWNIIKVIPIQDMGHLLKVIEDSTGTKVDLNDAEQKKFLIEVVKQTPTFKAIEEGNAENQFSDLAQEQINTSQLKGLIDKLKSNKDLLKSAGIQSIDRGKIMANVENTPQYDMWYKVTRQGKEIGFAKVRAIQGEEVELQHILGEEPQSGDGLTPMPSLGLQLRLGGGTSALGLGGNPQFGIQGYAPNYFTPQGQLQVAYNIGQFFPFSEFYVTLNGGAMVPQPAFALTQPVQPGLGVPGGNLPPQASLLAYNTELGLEKRFYFGPFYLNVAARGGMLGGVFMNAVQQQNPLLPPPTPLAFSFGGTALVGGHYQITPGLDVGLDAGFRYFDGGSWMLDQGFGMQPYQQISNPLQSIGPVLHASVGYQF